MIAALMLLIGVGLAEEAEQVPDHLSLPRYPEVARWQEVVATAVPGLQACVDAEGAPRSDEFEARVHPDGRVQVVGSAPSACWREVMEGVRFPAHDEDPVTLALRYPLAGRTVRPPMEITLPERTIGLPFVYVPGGLSADEQARVDDALRAWLSAGASTGVDP